MSPKSCRWTGLTNYSLSSTGSCCWPDHPHLLAS
jgi:NAD kinase